MTGYKPDGWDGTVADWNAEWDRRQRLGLWDYTTKSADKPPAPARRPALLEAFLARQDQLEARQ